MFKQNRLTAFIIALLLALNISFYGIENVVAEEADGAADEVQAFVPEDELPGAIINDGVTLAEEVTGEGETAAQTSDIEAPVSQEMIDQFNNNNIYHNISPDEFANMTNPQTTEGGAEEAAAEEEATAALAGSDAAAPKWDPYQPDLGLSPYNFSMGNENVSLTTGELSYNANIVSIKGRNGLDLNLSMQYSTGGAQASPGDCKGENENEIETSPGGLSSDVYFETKDPRYLGVGWSLSLPYISIRNAWYANTRQMNEYVLNLPGVGSYEFEDDLVLKHYKLNDLQLERDSGKFILTYKNGMRDEFDAAYGHLLKRQDRYGNEITFNYEEMESGVIGYFHFTKYLLSSITSDMFDRVDINYQYDSVATGKYIDKIVFSQGGTTLGIINLNIQNTLDDPKSPIPCVKEIIDGEGQKTEFAYAPVKLVNTSKNGDGTATFPGTKFNLKRITYPTGSYTEYNYITAKKQYTSHRESAYTTTTTKLSSREDIAPGETGSVNRIEYAYQGDATGAPYYFYNSKDKAVMDMADGRYSEVEKYFYHTTVTQVDGDTYKSRKAYTFDKDGNKVKDAEISLSPNSYMNYFAAGSSHIASGNYGFSISEDNRYLKKQNLITGEEETVQEFDNYNPKRMILVDSINFYIFTLQNGSSAFYQYDSKRNVLETIEMDGFAFDSSASVVYHQGALYIGGVKSGKFKLYKFDTDTGAWVTDSGNNIDAIEIFSTSLTGNTFQYCGASDSQLFYYRNNKVYAVNLNTKAVNICQEQVSYVKSYETSEEIGFIQRGGVVKKYSKANEAFLDDNTFKIDFNLDNSSFISYGGRLYCIVKEDRGQAGNENTLYCLEDGGWDKVLKTPVNTPPENQSTIRLGMGSNTGTLLIHNSRGGVEKIPLFSRSGNAVTGSISGAISEYEYNTYDLCVRKSDYIFSGASGRREENSTWVYDSDGYGNLTESNQPIVGKTTYTYYDASKYHQLDTETKYAGTPDAHVKKCELTADGLNVAKVTEMYKNNRQIITTNVYNADHKGNIDTTNVVDKTNGVEQDLGTTRFTYTDLDGNHYRFPSSVSKTAETYNTEFEMTPQEISTHYTYTPDGQVKTETDGLGRTKINEYYRNGALKTETAADGTQISYEYKLKNISSEISGVSSSSENKVITTAKNLNTEDPAYVTEESYDPYGRLMKQEERKGTGKVTLAEYAYDALGKPVSVWDTNGNETEYRYDWQGRVTQVTYPEISNGTLEAEAPDVESSAVQVSYDDAGLTQTVTDAVGVKTRAEFDVLGRVVKESGLSKRAENGGYVLRENPVTTVYTYDYMGNNTSIETGREETPEGELVSAGRKSCFTYNDLSQLLNTRNELNETTEYGYDKWGNVTCLLSAGGSMTHMSYDGFGRLLWKTQPTDKEAEALSDSEKQKYVYDAAGNLLKYKDQKGQTGTISYKANTDYIESQSVGEITNSFQYNGFGAVTEMTDSTGVTSYSYDYKNRLEKLKLPDEKELKYKYDEIGNVEYITDYFGNRHDYSYNAQNMLSRVSSGGKTVNYAYNGDGTLKKKEQTGSVYTTYSYDENKSLVSLVNQVKGSAGGGTYEYTSYSYQYNKYGEQTEKKEEYRKGTNPVVTKVTGYSYDVLGRLTKETSEERTTSYTYDANGNRITSAIEHTTGDQVKTALGSIDNILSHSINYSYDQANRLKKVTESLESGGSETSAYEGLLEIAEEYQYDGNGNLKTKAKSYMVSAEPSEEEAYTLGEDREKNSYVYEFDELNRMEKIYRGDGKWAEYSYDGTSARVGKTVGTAASTETETTKYYNMGATVLNEVSSNDGNTTNLIGAGIEARLNVSGGYFLQKNAHGDVTAAISGTERVATYDYDAFGNTLVEEGEINNPIRYSGEYLDEETGLIYLHARYYDSSIGRFISEDPIRDGMNWYAYCGNSPVMFADPLGLIPIKFNSEEDLNMFQSIAKTIFGDEDFQFDYTEENGVYTINSWDSDYDKLFGNGRGSDTGKALLKDILNLKSGDVLIGLPTELYITFSYAEERTREDSSYGFDTLTMRGWKNLAKNKLEAAVTMMHELTHVYTRIYGYETWLERSTIPLEAEFTNQKVVSRYREATAITVEEQVRRDLGAKTRAEVVDYDPKFLIGINGYGCWLVENLTNPASDIYGKFELENSLTLMQTKLIVTDILLKAGVL